MTNILNKLELRKLIKHIHTKFGRPRSYSLGLLGCYTDGQTDRWRDEHGYIGSAIDGYSEYIFFVGSSTPPSAFYIYFQLSQSINTLLPYGKRVYKCNNI